MADYTMPLWRALELTHDAGADPEFTGPNVGATVGLYAYPIFDETERPALNRKILDHYWMREIGQETIPLFTFMLRRTMREVMPLYNQLYLSSRIEFDPLATYKLTTVRDGTATEEQTAASTGHSAQTTTSGSRSVSSTTPQTMLAGSEDYATSAADANSSTTVGGDQTGNNTSSGSTNQNDTSTTSGFQGAASDLLTKFRNTILNIDMLVIAELNDNFMLTWSNREFLPSNVPQNESWY